MIFTEHTHKLLEVQFVRLELIVFLFEKVHVKGFLMFAVLSASYHVHGHPVICF